MSVRFVDNLSTTLVFVLRRSARFLFVGALCLVSGCQTPSDLGYWSTSALLRLDDDRFGVLVYPCTRGQVVTIELSLKNVDSGEVTPVLREEFSSSVDADKVMMTTGVDDPPFDVGSTRTVLDADLLERFNSDDSFAVGGGMAFVVQALDAEGVDQAGDLSGASVRRFMPEVGMVVVDSISSNDPLDSFTCPQDDKQAWHVAT